jgi:hypothetical protein
MKFEVATRVKRVNVYSFVGVSYNVRTFTSTKQIIFALFEQIITR